MNECKDTVVVIGGGPAGAEAALALGRSGCNVVLVEREPRLGGTLRRLWRSFPRLEDPREIITEQAAALGFCSSVTVMTGTEVRDCSREPERLLLTLVGAEETTLSAAAVVLATGGEPFDCHIYGEYGYGIYPGVYTALEFEDMLRAWGEGERPAVEPRSFCFVKCVGSRDPAKGHAYCSKICCMFTAKQAALARELFPEARCTVFYMDYRAAGRGYEEFVRETIEERGVRYLRGRPSKVVPLDDRLLIRAEDTLMGVPVETEADVIVLAAATEPSAGTRTLAKMLGAATGESGFLGTAEYPLRCGERLFFAGAAGYPLGIPEARAQGAAAAAAAFGLLREEGRCP